MIACTKRRFESVALARAAHYRAGYRLKVYRCPQCHGYHTSNADKTPPQTMESERRRLGFRRRRGPRRLPDLAPVRTLAEVEALAAQMRARAS